MANSHYTRTYNPQPTQRVGSTDLKNEFQTVEGGFDTLEAVTNRSLRQVDGSPVNALPSAASRALKVLSFDASGHPRTTIAETDLAAAVVSAASAAASAESAAASALSLEIGAGPFVSGQSYAIGDLRYSPINLLSYRAKTAGVRTTDPSLDATNWARVSGTLVAADIKTINGTSLVGGGDVTLASTPTITQRTITGADTLISTDQGKLVNASGAFTLSVTAAATLGNGWFCYLRNTSNGDVTVDPNASELIDGAATYVLKPGFTVLLTCTGTAIDVLKIKERTYTNIASYTASGTFVVPADTYVIRGYAFGSGAPGTATEGGAGGGCAYGDIAVTPGESVTVGIASGVATVTTAATARLTGNNAVTTTGGTATKHASVTNGGAYSGGNSTAGGYGGGSASGSPLGVGGNSGSQPGGAAWGGFAGGAGGGGGVGQAGGSSRGGDSLRNPSNLFTDPLLAQLTGAGGALSPTAANVPGGNGGPGGGGGCAPAYGTAGNGGIGAGGGGTVDGTGLAGAGGFGGGNGRGAGPEVQMPGGGGGGCGNSGTKFGAACVLIYY